MRTHVRMTVAVLTGAMTMTLAACGGGGSSDDGDAAAASSSSGAQDLFQQDLHDQLPQAVLDAGEIVFAGDAHPPYRVVGTDGEVTGFDPDLQAALGEVLGVETRTEIVQGLPAALTGMQAGRYDAFNGPVKDTVEREVDFDNVVYLTSRTAYLFQAESSVEDAADLCGQTVAYVTGSIVEGQVQALSTWCGENGDEPIATLPLADTNATVLAVQSGRAEAAGATQAAVLDIVAQAGDGVFDSVLQSDEQGAGVDQLALLTPKTSGLGPVLLEAFEVLFDTGTYDDLMEQYGFGDVAVDAPALNVAGGA